MYQNLTIIILAMDETYSLRETVEIIMSENKNEDVKEVMIVLNEKYGSPACIEIAKELSVKFEKVKCVFQKRAYAGGALQDGFEISEGSHLIMMSADLETDPHLIPSMIEQSKKYPDRIITVSRWNKEGGFKGYNKLKLLLNYLFQKIIALMFLSKLTDITYAYRLIPTKLVKTIDWKEQKHPMFLESAIVPIRLGVKFVEISGKWKARTEGISQNSFMANFNYFKTAFRVRFTKKNKLIKL
jgi:hypothetical protein